MLREHEEELPGYLEACEVESGKAVSEIDAELVHQWINDRKPFLKVVETDHQDARRRINLAKGPKSKRGGEACG